MRTIVDNVGITDDTGPQPVANGIASIQGHEDGSLSLEIRGPLVNITEETKAFLGHFGIIVSVGDSYSADTTGGVVTVTRVPGVDGGEATFTRERRGPTQTIRSTGIPSAEAVGTPTLVRKPPTLDQVKRAMGVAHGMVTGIESAGDESLIKLFDLAYEVILAAGREPPWPT